MSVCEQCGLRVRGGIYPLHCACGHTTQGGGTPKTLPKPAGVGELGHAFYRAMREYRNAEKACGCRDAAALMNRWGCELCRERIDQLVEIALHNATVDAETLRRVITEVIEEGCDH